jgi:hypothetical protein
MKTVPSWVSPLQYCAGWVALFVQSGFIIFVRRWVKDREDIKLTLTPQRKGLIEVPTTGSWLIRMSSSFLRIVNVSLVAWVSWKWKSVYVLWASGLVVKDVHRYSEKNKRSINQFHSGMVRESRTHDNQRWLHQCPSCEMGLRFFKGELIAIATSVIGWWDKRGRGLHQTV